MPNVAEVRAQFPALASGFAYLENAGGSQVPRVVAEAIHQYMLSSYVQLGAGYPQSNRATETVAQAHAFMREFVNAPAEGRVVLGPSTTALIQLVANAYAQTLDEGDEVIIANANHEAKVGGWLRLERQGVRIKWLPVDPVTFRSEPEALGSLLTDRTRLVAIPHVSNLVGQIEDLKGIVQISHKAGVKVFADGVAYAPHRAVDVQELGVDWYVFSAYKVFGPHMAVLYGTADAFDELEGPNHCFVDKRDPYKWELGGVSHEACAGLIALKDHLAFLSDGEYRGRPTVENAFTEIENLESEPESKLRTWLAQRPDVQLIGPSASSSQSVPTVSFVHSSVPSDHVATSVNSRQLGIRNGNMYAVRLLEQLGICPNPGVVRISLAHYNTVDEVDLVIAELENCFGPNP